MTETIEANLVVAGILVPMVWFLMRDIARELRAVVRQVSDLTLAVALDVATRPNATADTKRIARRVARDHGGDVRRADRLDDGDDGGAE